MKYLILAVLFLLSFSVKVYSADIPLEWRQSEFAVGYKISFSEDFATEFVTWTEIPNITFTTRTEGSLELASAIITIPDVLVLIRVAAYNSTGETWRLEAGAFYNTKWKPSPAPTGLGSP